MNFENYEISDFLMDESFHNWVKSSNSEDGRFWESWLTDHPNKINDADQAKKVLETISFKDKAFNKKEITDLWEKIKTNSIAGNDGTVEKSVKFSSWKYLKVAAVIFPFIIAGVLFLFFRELPEDNLIVKQVLIEKNNPRGEKRTVFLGDGSKVKLNAESKISYLKPFDEKQRIVQLEGEAFFEVISDKSRPFIVKSANLEIKVIGTSFNIKAYPDEDIIMVAVRTGMVSVENTNQKLPNAQNKSILLSPMEMATYSAATNRTSVSDYDTLKVLAWRDGTLYFNNATMEEFVAKMERWYGVDIIIKRNKPILKGITGTFKDQSLKEILMGTKDASEFEYEFLPDGKILIK